MAKNHETGQTLGAKCERGPTKNACLRASEKGAGNKTKANQKRSGKTTPENTTPIWLHPKRGAATNRNTKN